MNKKTQKTKPTTTTVTISDSTSKRQAEQALYQSSCALLNKYTDRLKYYEKQDRPAFTTWLNRELNEALTEYRHLRHLVDNMQSRVDDIIPNGRAFHLMRPIKFGWLQRPMGL